MKKILIICPAYNEATKLPKLIDEFKKTDHFNNLFVINSGSTDDTESILIKNNISHISLPINKGGGYAIVQGINYAIKNGFEICCVIAGNGNPKNSHSFSNMRSLMPPQSKSLCKRSTY